MVMEGPGYFGSERPDADHMSYQQLRDHVASLRASGFNVVPYIVALHRKISFPFVTVIMALIAVSVFAAVGAGGLIAPSLAAWAPNIIFGCAAMYLILTVRT